MEGFAWLLNEELFDGNYLTDLLPPFLLIAAPRLQTTTEWTELTKIYPSPGYISDVVTIFLATGLPPTHGERDEDEGGILALIAKVEGAPLRKTAA